MFCLLYLKFVTFTGFCQDTDECQILAQPKSSGMLFLSLLMFVEECLKLNSNI